jgi:hypothetical protein
LAGWSRVPSPGSWIRADLPLHLLICVVFANLLIRFRPFSRCLRSRACGTPTLCPGWGLEVGVIVCRHEKSAQDWRCWCFSASDDRPKWTGGVPHLADPDGRDFKGPLHRGKKLGRARGECIAWGMESGDRLICWLLGSSRDGFLPSRKPPDDTAYQLSGWDVGQHGGYIDWSSYATGARNSSLIAATSFCCCVRTDSGTWPTTRDWRRKRRREKRKWRSVKEMRLRWLKSVAQA